MSIEIKIVDVQKTDNRILKKLAELFLTMAGVELIPATVVKESHVPVIENKEPEIAHEGMAGLIEVNTPIVEDAPEPTKRGRKKSTLVIETPVEAPPPPKEENFNSFVSNLVQLTNDQKITMQEILEIVRSVGLQLIPDLSKREDLIPIVMARINQKIKEKV